MGFPETRMRPSSTSAAKREMRRAWRVVLSDPLSTPRMAVRVPALAVPRKLACPDCHAELCTVEAEPSCPLCGCEVPG